MPEPDAAPEPDDGTGSSGQPDSSAAAAKAGGPDPHAWWMGWSWLRVRRGADPQAWVRWAEEVAAHPTHAVPLPAWMRKTRGEHRWPVSLSVIAAITLQLLLPPHLTRPLPRELLPALEGALLVGLAIANPVRIERRGPAARAASIALIVVITLANAASAVLLIQAILEAKRGSGNAAAVLASGASVWATNVIAFALWYWELDRGGPVHRSLGTPRYPDLMFPQMATPELASPDWEPRFVDYLYMSFTNATAFSPTDVMPLARWAKLTMLVQSAVSLSVGALVIARAVNIL